MSTTMKEVARKAGVSIATVSRVFNNLGPVAEVTRKRVRKAAGELRYTPNAAGRSLSMRRTDSIGLLLPDLFGEFFSEVIRGADETAQKHHYHLIVSSSHNNREEIVAALKMMRGRVDGLVIMSPHIDAQSLNENLPLSLPVVLLNCAVKDDSFDSLNIDNFGGAYQMVRHLLGHGYRQIAIIKGTEHNLDADERLRGYLEALREEGVDRDPALELEGDFSEVSGFNAVKKILASGLRPRAIFASNDSMAIGALSALRDADVRVPEDIALAGFDDTPIAPFLSPALTSVRVNIHNFGILAVTQLLEAVSEKNAHRKMQSLLPTALSLRESCGCTDTERFRRRKVEAGQAKLEEGSTGPENGANRGVR